MGKKLANRRTFDVEVISVVDGVSITDTFPTPPTCGNLKQAEAFGLECAGRRHPTATSYSVDCITDYGALSKFFSL